MKRLWIIAVFVCVSLLVIWSTALAIDEDEKIVNQLVGTWQGEYDQRIRIDMFGNKLSATLLAHPDPRKYRQMPYFDDGIVRNGHLIAKRYRYMMYGNDQLKITGELILDWEIQISNAGKAFIWGQTKWIKE